MSDTRNAINEATQKPATVAVAPSGRSSRAVAPDPLVVAPVPLVVAPDPLVVAPVPLVVAPDPVQADQTAALRSLLQEALTVLTIYAEVAVPVPSYRGQPLSAHAPRELVERIHRAIGA